MAGIKLLEKTNDNMTLIIHKLLQPEIRQYLFDDMIGWQDITATLYAGDTLVYGVFEKGRPVPIGVVFITGVAPYRSGCLFAVNFDKENRGKGKMIGIAPQIASDLITKFKLHSLQSKVIGDNPRSKKILEGFGFEYIGTKKEFIFCGGEYKDVHEYYLLLSSYPKKDNEKEG